MIDQNVPVVEESSQQLLLSRVLNQINAKLSSGTDYQKLLDFIFDSLDLVIPYDRIGIAIVEGKGSDSVLSLKWVRSKVPVKHLHLFYSAPIRGSSLENILENKTPRVINDLIQYSAEHPLSTSTKLAIRDGIRSSLTCPLRSEDKQVGVVFFSSCSAHTYQNEHIQTYLEIADELSVIVDHGRLRRSAEESVVQKQNLNMVLHDLKSPLSVIQGLRKLRWMNLGLKILIPMEKKSFKFFSEILNICLIS